MKIDSIISYGYRDLMEIFFVANELDIKCINRYVEDSPLGQITFEYENDSDTAYRVTFMSMKHLGFENMLVDYLLKLGYPKQRISDGRTIVKRDLEQLDKDWQIYRKEHLGFR